MRRVLTALSVATMFLSTFAVAEPGNAYPGLPAASQFTGDAKVAYEAANAYPELAMKLFCYCGCDKEKGAYHKKLFDCYHDQHAVQCSICQGEMERAAEYKRQGLSDDDIAKKIDFEYQSRYPYNQPSDALQRYRAAHNEKA